MSNVIDYFVDVLAGSPDEIDRIAARLREPSPALLSWVAERFNSKTDEIAPHVLELVRFEPVDQRLNKARSFKCSFKKFSGIVNSHLFEVSEEFPAAVFLLEESDMQASYSGKMIIRGGETVQEVFDGKQRSQALDWVLPDVFAPFTAEWLEGLEFGSLWHEWLEEMTEAINRLRTQQGEKDATGEQRPNENRRPIV